VGLHCRNEKGKVRTNQSVDNGGLLETLTVSQVVKKLPCFMEPGGSLSHSQEPATFPYSEPAQSSP
jgi:hypothetical protein